MHIHATYDNTSGNPYNPNNPPALVTWGEGTTDEMYLVGTRFVPYHDGDENIVIGEDQTTSTGNHRWNLRQPALPAGSQSCQGRRYRGLLPGYRSAGTVGLV